MVQAAPAGQVAANVHRYWWLFLIRGLFGLALGVYAIVFPAATLAVLVYLIGAYLVVDGVLAVAKAVQIMRADRHWWAILLEGILGIVVGLAIFALPALSLLTLAYLVGFWALASGVLAIVSATRLRSHVGGEWYYFVFGAISIVFGAFVLAAPATGLVYLVWIISIYGFAMGITMIALAFRARRLPA